MFHTSGPHAYAFAAPPERCDDFLAASSSIFFKIILSSPPMAQMWNIVYGLKGQRPPLLLARQLVKAVGGKISSDSKRSKKFCLSYCECSCFQLFRRRPPRSGGNDGPAHMGSGSSSTHFKPIVRTSIENAFQQSPAPALTGPIARGNSYYCGTAHARAAKKR